MTIFAAVLRSFRRGVERTQPASESGSAPSRKQAAGRNAVTQRTEAVDAAIDAYVEWREECTAVRDAYRRWTCAPAVDVEAAFLAYGAALDREQAAADVYEGLMAKVGHLMESGLDYPLSAPL